MTPQKYRLKIVEFEAEQVSAENAKLVALWCGGVTAEEIDNEDRTLRFAAVNVPSLNGTHRASEGDYVVKKPNGGFEVIKKYHFEANYELVG